ncbi:J domain-containing protein [Forsythia ovata]|uniref:J domain-containing protein n=1 Tax=Forsythia ovata TaxID=205694 RepID=A0ABD1P4H9_9LAMI
MSRGNTNKVYPRKGETWAVFKNWDRNWFSDSERRRNYEFEFVEENAFSELSEAGINSFPDPRFHNFDAERSYDKLQVGQIWAIYGDKDGLPKYYGQIEKIETCQEFVLHVNWLLPCSPPGSMIRWLDKDMPVPAGNLRFIRENLTE